MVSSIDGCQEDRVEGDDHRRHNAHPVDLKLDFYFSLLETQIFLVAGLTSLILLTPHSSKRMSKRCSILPVPASAQCGSEAKPCKSLIHVVHNSVASFAIGSHQKITVIIVSQQNALPSPITYRSLTSPRASSLLLPSQILTSIARSLRCQKQASHFLSPQQVPRVLLFTVRFTLTKALPWKGCWALNRSVIDSEPH